MTSEFAEALKAALGSNVVFGADIAPRFFADWSGLDPVKPLALVRPRTTEEVAATLKLCNRFAVPVVPQGGLTGLAGGALPLDGSIALSLDRMSGIEEVDTVMATMTVLAGTSLSTVQAAAQDAGLFFGLDLGSRESCTIGGNVGTNAGGNRVIRYGMTREHILGMEVVLPDGTIVRSLNKMLKNNAGYDLKQLFIGSEGTLGVVTRVVLRLQAKPGSMLTAFCGCKDFGAVRELLKISRTKLGPSLTSFEVMWPNYYDFMTSKVAKLRRAFSESHGCYVLIEVSGFDPEQNTNLLQNVLAAAHEDGFISNAVIAASEREAKELWAVRENVPEFLQIVGAIQAFDLGLPTSQIGAFVTEIEAAYKSRWTDAVVVCYGHIGDSNLHLLSNIPSAGKHQPDGQVYDLVYGAVGNFGGTVSAEHGIGLLKKRYLPYSRTAEELDVMARIKRALDPNNILNTGKVISV